jgi:hypothetical protein
MDDIAFRIAILDTTKKTAEIALAYHVSVSHVRTLRAKAYVQMLQREAKAIS